MLIAQGAFEVVWEFYDAFTGAVLFNTTNPPSGHNNAGSERRKSVHIPPQLRESAAEPNWYQVEWNSSRLWDNSYSGPSTTPTFASDDKQRSLDRRQSGNRPH